ncbi:hypothetical protein CDD83_7855 [Cordyceps sp. RAO-2017]|nr:hypothetical protein CDD83_7855 [Cordyceps sp. RAO-2017]
MKSLAVTLLLAVGGLASSAHQGAAYPPQQQQNSTKGMPTMYKPCNNVPGLKDSFPTCCYLPGALGPPGSGSFSTTPVGCKRRKGSPMSWPLRGCCLTNILTVVADAYFLLAV